MEHIHSNLMKLGGLIGNVPQEMENLLEKLNINCILENGLTVLNKSSFYNKFFRFVWNVT
jgi:hypothetical protein